MSCTCETKPSTKSAVQECINDFGLPPEACRRLTPLLDKLTLGMSRQDILRQAKRWVEQYLNKQPLSFDGGLRVTCSGGFFGETCSDQTLTPEKSEEEVRPPAPVTPERLLQLREQLEQMKTDVAIRTYLQPVDPGERTLIGYACIWGVAHKAGFGDHLGRIGLHQFQRGCFSDAIRWQSLKPFLSWSHAPYPKYDAGTLELTEDDIGLLVTARITDEKLIHKIVNNELSGMSVMALPERSHSFSGVQVHSKCGLEEVSVADANEAGNPLCCCLIVEVPEHRSPHLHRLASGFDRKAAIVKRLLAKKRELAV